MNEEQDFIFVTIPGHYEVISRAATKMNMTVADFLAAAIGHFVKICDEKQGRTTVRSEQTGG